MSKKSTRLDKIAALPQPVERLIRLVRGHKVMLDADLAKLYGVPTKRLNEAVRRNLRRFPQDFMFRLSRDEAAILRSQIATLENGRGKYSKYPPLAFTEHGVVMLSSVLNSDRAIQMSILVVNTFVRLRELIAANKDFAARMEKLEQNHKHLASVIDVLVDDIESLRRTPTPTKESSQYGRRRIGYIVDDD